MLRLSVVLFVLISNLTLADVVTPTDRVTNCVNVRPDPTSTNPALLCLKKGEYIEYVETVLKTLQTSRVLA